MTPPVITTKPVEMEFVIWPPNHKYETFVMSDFVLSVDDNCASLTINDVYIVKATSGEPEDALGEGDGNTMDDMVIADDCKSIQLRKERQGGGNGRVYTIFLELDDGGGNTGYATCQVQVPHNIGETAIDDGMAYEVACGNKSFSIATNENSESDIELINFPNPFTTSTTFSYRLETISTVTIQIFNPQGQLIERIEQEQPQGEQHVQWNAEGLPGGMYYFRIKAGDKIVGGKMVKMD